MKTNFWLTLGLLIAATTGWSQENAEFTVPGWFRPAERLVQPQLTEWSQAAQLAPDGPTAAPGGFRAMSLVSTPEIAEAITPEIQALARGLENDPQAIFGYVRDHIQYVHYFGSKKGAQLTLLERSGNDFDQCALLVALLRAAGYSASYRFGTVFAFYSSSSHYDFKHWLGLTEPNNNWSNSLSYVMGLNNYRGYPFTGGFTTVSNALVFHHVWVRLTWNGTVYPLDPAFKIYEPITGTNLSTAIGLDTNQLMTSAGGTVNANYVLNLTESTLRNKLRDYTTSLVGYIQSNNPNASIEEFIGGQHYSQGQNFGDSLPFSAYTWSSNSPAVDWDYIPTNLMTTLNITVDTTTNCFLYMPQLQGQRLSLTFSNNGVAQLWLEDDLMLQKQTSGGSTANVAISVDHPHGTWDWSNNRLINTNWNDHTVTNTYQRTNATYAICYAFEANQEWLSQRQHKLDLYRQQGLADTSRQVTSETLNIMGLNWMLQTELLSRTLCAQQDMLLQHHHRVGRMAQEYGKGYYVDIYEQLNGGYPASGNTSNDLARADKAFDLGSYFGSAAEHGLIEQLQASNLVAASTVKMLQIGNTNGQRTYIANTANWSTVNGSLSNYDKNYLKTNFIDPGYTLLLPANGANTVGGAGTWSGYGVVARGVITNSTGVYKDMIMLISGGYNGGYVSYPSVSVDTPYVSQSSYSQPTYFNPVSPYVATPVGADPVNMADGSFQLNATDLSIGQSAPRGIGVSRFYSSSRRNHNLAGMANGWVHSYYIRATDVSAPAASLGDTTLAQMAPLIVATRAAFALYSTTPTPKNWAVSSLIAKWGVDQMINNAVSVTLGKDTLQFMKQPDGTFTAPAGSTMTLSKTGGVYWLKERNGNTFKFNSAGYLTNIVDQYNQGLKVTWNSSNWVDTVKDWKDRQFTFNYSGTPQRLTSITDNTAPTRTIYYGYTGSGSQFDLTSFTDAEGKTSSITYDGSHQITATKDALNRVVVSNAYDGFGRVIEQYSKGDTNQTWRLYWSGYQNTEQDPAGGSKQYYYDDNHRLIITVDANSHHNYTVYDGQDHVVQTATHLLAVTDYGYDGRHNLTYVNDPLSCEIDYYYDSQDRVYHIWDKRGGHSYFGYNAQSTLTGSTNAMGDWITYGINADGTTQTRTDPGGTTTYGYDSKGQLNSILYPANLGTEGFLNSDQGDVLSHTNGRGFVTSFQYSKRRELTNTIAPTNLTSKVTFDAVGNVESVTDARSFTTSSSWSATRKLLSTTSPATPQGAPVTTNAYDSRDWLVRRVNPLQQTTSFTNDPTGRLLAVTDPLQHPTRFGYDDDDHKIATTNAAGEIVRQSWSQRGDLMSVTDAANHALGRKFDANGNQTALTNRNSKVWSFQLDKADRLTNTISPLNRQTKQVFNNRGLLQSVTEPSTQTANLQYDARGRLTNRTDAVGTAVYAYDANNNRTNVTEGGKTASWTFDAYDRATTYTDADGNLFQYRYDANGNLTNLVYPGGKNVYYSYDSLNRLTNVTDWAQRQTSFTYDLANHLRTITRPNGTVRTTDYDDAGQPTGITEKTAGNIPIAVFRLNWDNAGRTEWEYAAPVPHYNPVPTRNMTYDDDNRLTNYNSQQVQCDSDGNMTYGPLTTNTFGTYNYDARNRLLSAGGLSYGYDMMANRTSVTNGAAVTRYVVNPNAALSQVLMRVKNGTTNYYVYGLGLLYEADDSGNTKTYHYDNRGSTVAITSGNGMVTDRIEYSAYGITTYRVGLSDTPFLFNGRYGVMTDANGLLYMRARYYNPWICRFVNPDPAGFAGGLNFYCFANGNPISLIDPFGLWSWSQTFGVVRAVGGLAEAAAGVTFGAATSWTGVGAVGGGVVAAHGLDQIQAGIRQAWNGGHVDSLTSSGLQAAGMSQNAANWTDAGISVVGSFGAGLATTAIRAETVISAQTANAGVFKQAVYYEIGQKTVSEDANAFYSLWSNPVDRGAAIVADQGWRAALTPNQTGWILGAGQTFLTGPTPLGLFGASSLGAAANAVGK